jgi:membrane protein YqaA with SNARE-associated domain
MNCWAQQNKDIMIERNSAKRLELINRYYKITKFYPFLKDVALKGSIAAIAFVLVVVGLELFVLDINTFLNNLVATYSPQFIFSFFLISETVLGLIPPEVFIAWASKSVTPWLFLLLLATMSYIGGIISYIIGNRIFLIPSVKNHLENKIARHITNLRKWGGFFVFVGAMLPIPHSVVSLASGLIKYNFKHYLLWALFRYVRFAIYAAVIFQIF